MKISSFGLFVSLMFVSLLSGYAGTPPNFTGEYADNKFMNGQAVFQLSIEQSGTEVSIFFSAARKDGQGAAPEVDTQGQITGKGTVEFKFEDSMNNSGTGTITRAGDDMILTLKPNRVSDPRCLQFYKSNMRLKRVKK